jgi:hypothetical protein
VARQSTMLNIKYQAKPIAYAALREVLPEIPEE